MASRMDRYGSAEGTSRTQRNRSLYDTLYDSREYSIKTNERTLTGTNELNLEAIKSMIAEEKKYEKKISPVPKEIVDDHEEEKAYDINEVLMQAKNNYKEDNLKRSLKQNPYEIRENIEKLKEEEEKPEVIDDMFGDLMATKTLKDGSIKEMIEKEKEDFEETTKATMNLGLVDKDFEELKDMHNSIKKNNILLKIFLGILILLALLVTAYAIYKII